MSTVFFALSDIVFFSSACTLPRIVKHSNIRVNELSLLSDITKRKFKMILKSRYDYLIKDNHVIE